MTRDEHVKRVPLGLVDLTATSALCNVRASPRVHGHALKAML